MLASEVGTRSSRCIVSGRRRAAQTNTIAPNRPRPKKIARQGSTSMTICPIDGARIGTARNTMKASDMTRAIFRPE